MCNGIAVQLTELDLELETLSKGGKNIFVFDFLNNCHYMDFIYFDIQIGLEWKKVDKNEYRSEQKRNPDHVFLR